MKKGHLRTSIKRCVSVALILSMIIPVGIKKSDVEAKVIDANYDKEVLWSTSFESTDNFRTTSLDDKGSANVSTTGKTMEISGDLSSSVGSYSGSDAHNTNEVLANLFDGNVETKYLTSASNPEIIVKLKNDEKKVIKSYILTSANDETGRDPKAWTLQGRNSDSESWVTIDSRTGQKFNGRYTQKYYNVSSNTTAYSQYRLSITANRGGGSLTQLSEFKLATEAVKVSATCDNMKSEITSGPSDAWNNKTNVG